MFGIKSQITKCIDDEGYPTFVECQFIDARGGTEIFNDKDAIFTTELLDINSNSPIDGVVGCEIIDEKTECGNKIVKVNTAFPWHIESTKDKTVFEVLQEQIIEFEHLI